MAAVRKVEEPRVGGQVKAPAKGDERPPWAGKSGSLGGPVLREHDGVWYLVDDPEPGGASTAQEKGAEEKKASPVVKPLTEYKQPAVWSTDEKRRKLQEAAWRVTQCAVRPRHMLRSKNAQGCVLKLTRQAAVASSAATALEDYFTVLPSDSAEYASVAALYSEIRVVHTTIHFRASLSGVSGPVDVGVAYDVTNPVVLGSVRAVLPYASHKIVNIPGGLLTDACFSPIGRTSNGFLTVKAKVPTNSTRNVATAASLTGWASTGDSADIWGYWKVYATAASSSIITTVLAYIEMTCEFRNRE